MHGSAQITEEAVFTNNGSMAIEDQAVITASEFKNAHITFGGRSLHPFYRSSTLRAFPGDLSAKLILDANSVVDATTGSGRIGEWLNLQSTIGRRHGTIINRGQIVAGGNENLLEVGFNDVEHGPALINEGIMTVQDNGALRLHGQWLSPSQLHVKDHGTLYLGGIFGSADFNAVQQTGGTIVLEGTIENQGSTVQLPSSLGRFRAQRSPGFIDPKIKEGIVQIIGGTPIVLDDRLRLENVDLYGSIDVTHNGQLTVTSYQGNTQLNGSELRVFGSLNIYGGDELQGTGRIRLLPSPASTIINQPWMELIGDIGDDIPLDIEGVDALIVTRTQASKINSLVTLEANSSLTLDNTAGIDFAGGITAEADSQINLSGPWSLSNPVEFYGDVLQTSGSFNTNSFEQIQMHAGDLLFGGTLTHSEAGAYTPTHTDIQITQATLTGWLFEAISHNQFRFTDSDTHQRLLSVQAGTLGSSFQLAIPTGTEVHFDGTSELLGQLNLQGGTLHVTGANAKAIATQTNRTQGAIHLHGTADWNDDLILTPTSSTLTHLSGATLINAHIDATAHPLTLASSSGETSLLGGSITGRVLLQQGTSLILGPNSNDASPIISAATFEVNGQNAQLQLPTNAQGQQFLSNSSHVIVRNGELSMLPNTELKIGSDSSIRLHENTKLAVATMHLVDGSQVFGNGGTLEINRVVGDFTVAGITLKSLDRGSLQVEGDFTLTESATAHLNIFNTLSPWSATGDLTLGGTLNIRDISPTSSLFNTPRTILTSSNTSGMFDQIIARDVWGRTLAVTYSENDVLIQSAIIGDTNFDGMIDAEDLQTLATGFNQQGSWVEGDFNGDAMVNLDDLTILGTFWGTGVPAADAVDFQTAMSLVSFSMPEPASAITLLSMTGFAWGRRRRAA